MSYLVGFTGTQIGMTQQQRDSLTRLLHALQKKHGRVLLAHGDCVGADEQADHICWQLGIPRGIYPANIESKRAHCYLNGAVVLADPGPPLLRNHKIITGRQLLVAAPRGFEEERRSGTWYTVRRAREHAGIHIVVLWPDGRASIDFPLAERRDLWGPA